MYTIQYANGSRIWDVVKTKLHDYVVASEHDIADIYEQGTPVTKRTRRDMREIFDRGGFRNATPAARRFMSLG